MLVIVWIICRSDALDFYVKLGNKLFQITDVYTNDIVYHLYRSPSSKMITRINYEREQTKREL